ncbi:uncharacterized protein LOC101679005 isoform X7 [Mustela putorius furo]|uniref:Uncharacterized protein LOC101679005 isoform X7 n=1 Tax=Mustela putorius furo TaxID=9669 RepID=A0A8U0SE34_MUSPF|nr:uncharacterized protein LOC101679005 isoform X7 [Mustela putorius furo]
MLRQVPPGWKVLKLLHLELFKHEDVGIFDDAYPMWITTIWLLGILYLKEVLSGDYGSLGTLHAQVTPTSKDRALSPIWLSRESAY